MAAGIGSLGIDQRTGAAAQPAERTKDLSAELANRRLAIMAIIGRILHVGLTGSACGACALYTASTLRAFDNELGIRAPVCFCDPAGFTADGNFENFASSCQAERKPSSPTED